MTNLERPSHSTPVQSPPGTPTSSSQSDLSSALGQTGDGRSVRRGSHEDARISSRSFSISSEDSQASEAIRLRERSVAVSSATTLPTFAELVKQMGRAPKKDLKILGHEFALSSRYKAVGAALDAWHKTASDSKSARDPQALREALTDVHAAVLWHLDAHDDAPMKALLDQAISERSRLLARAADGKSAGQPAALATARPGREIQSSRLPQLMDSKALLVNFEKPTVNTPTPRAQAHVSGYADIEAAADNYRAVLLAARHGTNDAQRALGALQHALARYETAVDWYVSAAPPELKESSERNALVGYMKDFARDSLASERALCDDVEAVLKDAGPSPSISAGHLLDLRRSGVGVDALKDALRRGLEADSFDGSTEAAASRAGLAIDAKSIPSYREIRMREVGAGAMSTVSELVLPGPGGRSVAWLFKPENPDAAVSACAVQAGIPATHAYLTGRFAASSLMDELLGLDLLVRSSPATVNGQLGVLMQRAEGTPLMGTGRVAYPISPSLARRIQAQPEVLRQWAKQQGFSSAECAGTSLVVSASRKMDAKAGAAEARLAIFTPLDLDDARVREELTNLQWLDQSTAELDRGPYNIFQRVRDGKFDGMTGIDCDTSFGDQVTKLGDMVNRADNQRAGPPPVIGRRLYDRFASLNKDLAEQLRRFEPLLKPAEVRAHQARLANIQKALEQLQAEGRVLEAPGDWLSPSTTDALGITAIRKAFADALPQPGSAFDLGAVRKRVLDEIGQTAKQAGYAAREALNQAWARWGSEQQHADRAELFLDISRLEAMLKPEETDLVMLS